MGLLKRARSLHGASRSDRVTSKGLLQKSLELIEKLLPQQQELKPTVDQKELDAPSSASFSAVPAGTEKKSPETVPRTWKESGQASPEEAVQTPSESQQLTEAQRHERLWAGLREIEEGIEFPGRLFSLVKEQLQLERAALLLYDPVRMAFAPWAVHGFDETTNHRLRIPLGANDTMNRLASGKVRLLSGPEQLQPFQQFFSLREFSTLSNLLLVPFIYESKFMGLLLSAQSGQTNLEPFETLADRAAGYLYSARERHLEGAKRGTPQQPQSLREAVRAALQPCLEKGFSPLLIRINTRTLIESVQKRNPYIDLFRLNQDISRVVLSLFQSLGSVFQVDRERMLILVTNKANPLQEGDCELLLYHLKATLGRLLPELAGQEQIDLDEQVRIPSPDIEEALTYLAEIV
jgi:hypothetical protein